MYIDLTYYMADWKNVEKHSTRSLYLLDEVYLEHCYCGVGRDSSVGIATRYGLDSPRIESRWGGEIFRTRPARPWGPPNLLYSGYQVSFPVVKRRGAWR